MKKTLLGAFMLMFGFVVIALSSCKSHENCPAYGQKAEAAKAISI